MSCPPPPPLSQEQLGSESAALMESAGIRTCETDQSSATMEGHVSAPFGLGNAGISATMNHSSTIGCEQIAVITDKYRKAVSNTTCLLKESKNIVKNSIAGINSVVFEAGRHLDVNCNGEQGLSIKQKMSLDMISQINLSQTELSQIQDSCKDVVKSFADAAMSSNNGLGATPQGQKLIKDTLTDIQQTDYKASIAKTLNETLNSQQGSNIVLFKAGGDVRISGSRCVFEQDMMIKMVAASTIDSTLSDMMSNLSETLNDTSVKATTKADNRGADDLAAAVKTTSEPLFSTKTMIIIAVIVGIVVIGGVVIAIVKSKSPSPTPSQYLSRYSFPRMDINNNKMLGIFLLVLLLIVFKSNIKQHLYDKPEKVFNF